jgi:hypothetical protein
MPAASINQKHGLRRKWTAADRQRSLEITVLIALSIL